ncbi:dioxygenase [Bradyrhizobium prioriisuperbiae]|uniref:dioxygenase family protein n=1 Tax=Bradyrhizobium prioriisuperbiae TaxID=2854389 RepID=UPI0028E7075A|nr:dioxygenase [Bradyrhizobium prioritasuperba]
MRDLTTTSVTDAVFEQMGETPNPRLKQVMESLVRHMHDFARDVELTPDEWLKAIGFLTKVGQTCTPARQEFILLSDVLGFSALVNLLHDKTAVELGTESSLLGPFYQQNAPSFALGDSIAATSDEPELLLYGQVTDKTGKPLPNASVQVWQTDAKGEYDLQKFHGEQMDMRGNFRCDSEGRFHFRAVKPLGYYIPMDGPVGALIRAQRRHGCRPAHIHFLIGADGYRELVTAIYLADDEHIDSDTVFGVSSSLVVSPRDNDPDAPIKGIPAIRYDFRLGRAADNETGRVGADPSQILSMAE